MPLDSLARRALPTYEHVILQADGDPPEFLLRSTGRRGGVAVVVQQTLLPPPSGQRIPDAQLILLREQHRTHLRGLLDTWESDT